MVPVTTTKSCAEVFAHFLPANSERPPATGLAGLTAAVEADKKYFSEASLRGVAAGAVCVVGVDVASNALAYGKAVGLFDEVHHRVDTPGVIIATCTSQGNEKGMFDRQRLCHSLRSFAVLALLQHKVIVRNLEVAVSTSDSDVMAPGEVALVRRARLVLATGAFSYITEATLRALFACWGKEGTEKEAQGSDSDKEAKRDLPVFLFFPLVTTEVGAIRSFFERQGLEVFYAPGAHWLPQRRFADAYEAKVVGAAEAAVLAREVGMEGGDAPRLPPGALVGHLHATPLIAGPAGMGIQALAATWLAPS
jgi:hypothetical protein